LHKLLPLALVAAAGAVIALLVGSTPAPAAFPGANGKIAFVSDRDGNWEIYVMDADGTNQTRLTTNAAIDSNPSWSPDGTKIAFASYRDGNAEIYVMDAGGGNQTRLTTDAAYDEDPSWSPDGTKIAFQSTRDGYSEIYVMDADGGNQTRLTTNLYDDSAPDWSPDGTKIAFKSYRDGKGEIYVMDAGGGNQTLLTKTAINPSWTLDGSPSWSPDGTKIAFKSYRDGNFEIYVMDADGSNQTRLTTTTAYDYFPDWSPDGTEIAFASGRDGNGEIYVMDADGTNPTRLTTNVAWDGEPSWQPIPGDTTPPDTTISAHPASSSASTSASFSFGSSESGSSFECRLDAGSWSACTSPKAYSSLAQGSHTFQVRAIDAAHNVDPTPAGYSWTVASSAKPVFAFSAASYSVSEGAGSAVITIKRSGSTSGANTVAFITANGTATAGSDYTAVRRTVSFAAGVSAKTVSVPIKQDTLSEGDETVSLSLSGPSSGSVLGTQKAATLTIKDDETTPTFFFSATSYAVSEASGSAVIAIKRSGSTSAAKSVVFKTANGTALAGSDYTAVSKTVSFAKGVTSQTVSVPIKQDTLAEGDETVQLSLSSPSSGSVLGTQKSAVLTIHDDETKPTFFFSATSYSVGEGAGSAVIAIKRSGSTAAAGSVLFKTANGTATAGSDYTTVSKTVSFAKGATSVNVTVPITNDKTKESAETIKLSLSSPSSGSVLGTQKAATLTIVDND
jgi:Tol biopolymer transport system component